MHFKHLISFATLLAAAIAVPQLTDVLDALGGASTSAMSQSSVSMSSAAPQLTEASNSISSSSSSQSSDSTSSAAPQLTGASNSTSSSSSSSTSQSSSSTSSTASATPTNNGQIFTNQCNSTTGLSIAQCAELLNIAALNDANINADANILSSGSGSGSGSQNGSTSGNSTTSPGNTNNGQQFLNQCQDFGASLLQCTRLLNLAILNGGNINILVNVLSLLGFLLGVPVTALPGGLVAVPTALLPTE